MNSQPTSNVRWLLISWLFVLSAVAYLDRVNLSIAGAKLTEEFAITNVQLGLVFSAFLLGYALFQAPAGWLADRFGPRRVLTAGVIWWGVFSALMAAISHGIANVILVLLVLRFLLGAGEAIIYPASNQFVARWIPRQERGKANGFIFAGVGIGAGVTPPFISYLMLHYGWRSSFLVSALIGLAAGTVWYLAARDTPETHPAVSPNELAFIQEGIGGAKLPGTTGLLFMVHDLVQPQRLDSLPSLTFVSATSPGFSSAGFIFISPGSAGWTSNPAPSTPCFPFWRWPSAVLWAAQSAMPLPSDLGRVSAAAASPFWVLR